MSEVVYANLALDWSPDRKSDQTVQIITAIVLVLMLMIGGIFSSIEVPKEERSQRVKVPERIAQFVLQKEKPKPRVVKAKPKPKPKPKQKPKPKVKKKKAEQKKPLSKAQKKARKKAEKTGLLALGEELADLMDTSEVSAMVGGKISAKSSTGSLAASTNKQLLMADVSKGSGGVSTETYTTSISVTKLSTRQITKVEQSLTKDKQEAEEKAEKSRSRKAGIRAEEEITIVFDQNKSKLYSVYSRARRKNPGLKGKIILEITILPSGKVSNIKIVSSDLHDAKLEKKLVTRIKQFDFGEKKVETVTVTYPIEFLPS